MSSILIEKASEGLSLIPLPILLACLLPVLTWVYYRVARGKYDSAMFNKLPGPTPIPILGNALELAVPHQKTLQVRGKLSTLCIRPSADLLDKMRPQSF